MKILTDFTTKQYVQTFGYAIYYAKKKKKNTFTAPTKNIHIQRQW